MKTRVVDRRGDGSTPLEQARLVQLYLLDVFCDICKENGLRYWLNFGTLIGAMRHDGFIPWDDDVDVSMPLADYKKFRAIAKESLPDTVLFQDLRKTPGSLFSFGKLRDRCSFYCQDDTVATVPCGIFIDIFPWARTPRLPRVIVNAWCHLQYSSLRHAGAALARPRVCAMAKMLDCMVSLLWKFIYWLSYVPYVLVRVLMPSHYWRSMHDTAAKYFIPEEKLFPLTTHVFEGRDYAVPRDSDYVLSQEFGDWRTLPPANCRQYHATIITAKQTPPHVWWAKKYSRD